MSSTRHVRHLMSETALHDSALGRVTRVSKQNFPILDKLSMKRVTLKPGAIREPHWHANANELTFCIEGRVVVTLIGNKDVVTRFAVNTGEMFFAPNGSLHSFENAGDTNAELVVAFSHEEPSDFSLHATFGAMSDAVLGNTFGLPDADFSRLPRDKTSPYLVKGTGKLSPILSAYAEPYKFAIEAQQPPINFPYGTARVSRTQMWPTLQNIAMYAIDIPDNGMREVHWHPETAEMGYVHKGKARMTILDPDGTSDTYLLEAGDCYFVPRAYPHQIEALGEEIHFLIFFDQTTPGDIGLRLCGSAVAPSLLAATFGVDEAALPRFPNTPEDPLIVEKINPVDPIGG